MVEGRRSMARPLLRVAAALSDGARLHRRTVSPSPFRLPPRAHGWEGDIRGRPFGPRVLRPLFGALVGPGGPGLPLTSQLTSAPGRLSAWARPHLTVGALVVPDRPGGATVATAPRYVSAPPCPIRTAPTSAKTRRCGSSTTAGCYCSGPHGPHLPIPSADARPVHAFRLPLPGQAVKPQKLQFRLPWGACLVASNQSKELQILPSEGIGDGSGRTTPHRGGVRWSGPPLRVGHQAAGESMQLPTAAGPRSGRSPTSAHLGPAPT